jgi:ABC transporter with metal-binding/Fe-S-binding domain ATP-binding protein
MKVGILFSGGKDSTYTAFIAKRMGYNVSCLISLVSNNKESYMFHTPSIKKTEEQAKVMGIPILTWETEGKKEEELKDLEKAIRIAIKEYRIEGIVTGAIQSIYQSSRIQKICNKLKIECFNPLWQKNEENYLTELLKNKFKVMITGVFAFPFDNKWLGKEIDKKLINEVRILNKKYGISIIGEGGEFETLVVNCPLFKKEIKIKSFKDFKEGENSWRREIK